MLCNGRWSNYCGTTYVSRIPSNLTDIGKVKLPYIVVRAFPLLTGLGTVRSKGSVRCVISYSGFVRLQQFESYRRLDGKSLEV